MRMWHVYHPIHSNRYTILYIIIHIFMNIITHTIIRIIIYLQITYNVVICEISVQDVYYCSHYLFDKKGHQRITIVR